MSHLECPECGVVIADRDGHQAGRPCPRCFVRRGVVISMERPRAPVRPAPVHYYQLRGH